MRINKVMYFIFVFLVITFSSGVTFALTPEAILKKAESIRAPFENFVMDLDITSPHKNMSFRVYAKRGEGNLVLFLKPVIDKGKLLMMKGEHLWFYAPKTYQAHRLNPRQRLIGAIANGDVSRLRWSIDYDAKQIREDEKTYELELTSNNRGATYYLLEILIEKHTFKPLRVNVYLRSGKLYKTIYYSGFKSISGKLMSTKLKFIDHLRNGEESEMVFSNVKSQKIPEIYFNEKNLPKLSETLTEE